LYSFIVEENKANKNDADYSTNQNKADNYNVHYSANQNKTNNHNVQYPTNQNKADNHSVDYQPIKAHELYHKNQKIYSDPTVLFELFNCFEV